MVEGRLTLEPEVQTIFDHIDKKHNFLLSGGAGSGKTYSLVQVIRQAIAENPISKIACMTYTNAAVREIEERVDHKNLSVSTIHDFLWDNIKSFQKELKVALIAMANDSESKISIPGVEPIPDNFFNDLEEGIQYKEYLKIREGIISHDELLVIAKYLFEKHIKLCDIVKDKYPFIFIDEYQDTNEAVVNIFLDCFSNSTRQNCVGFFGDSMQSIYDDGIGNLDNYITEGKVFEVKKKQNRRNPQKIINLANRLRTDGIIQEPSKDENAPNMINGRVKEGNMRFIYSRNSDLTGVKQFLSKSYNWDFSDPKKTKELNLTHNLIANRAGFRTLMDIYDKDRILEYKERVKRFIKKKAISTDFSNHTFGQVLEVLESEAESKDLKALKPTETMQRFIDENTDLYELACNMNYSVFSKTYVNKEQLIDDKKQDEEDENKKGSKRDGLVRHLFKIQTNISLYRNGQYNEFLRVTDYRARLTSIQEKRILKKNIEKLVQVGEKTIEEIITDADEKGICLIDDTLNAFKEKNGYIYSRVKNVKFQEFQQLFKFLEGQTPFSTQHKTKGTEFDNVLVILDNGNWNNYNFKNLFLETGKQSVLERTQKIFYVCCTRTMEHLAIFYQNPSEEVIGVAKKWFGEKSLVDLDG